MQYFCYSNTQMMDKRAHQLLGSFLIPQLKYLMKRDYNDPSKYVFESAGKLFEQT